RQTARASRAQRIAFRINVNERYELDHWSKKLGVSHDESKQAVPSCSRIGADIGRQFMTPLDKPIKRALAVGGKTSTVTFDPDGVKLVEKGHRRGIELRWKNLLSGDAGLAAALQASLAANRKLRA